jgi:hypothetical protein
MSKVNREKEREKELKKGKVFPSNVIIFACMIEYFYSVYVCVCSTVIYIFAIIH